MQMMKDLTVLSAVNQLPNPDQATRKRLFVSRLYSNTYFSGFDCSQINFGYKDSSRPNKSYLYCLLFRRNFIDWVGRGGG